MDEGFWGEHWASGQVRSDTQINVASGFSRMEIKRQIALLAHEALHIVDRRSGALGNIRGFFSHLGASITGGNLYAFPNGGVGRSYRSLNFEQRAVVLEATAFVMLGVEAPMIIERTGLAPKMALRLYGEYRAGKP